MVASYVPEWGDVVWLTFNPQAGHEQAGRRPALVLSPVAYNRRVGLGLFCPITSQRKGYPFEVLLPQGLAVTGVVLADQIRNLDWRSRNAVYADTPPAAVTEEVLKKLAALLSLDHPRSAEA